jgi:ribokinase
VADALAARGVHNAVITLGPDGAVVLDDSRVSVLPAVPVNAIDTTGCGDAFMGAVAAELAAGNPLVEAARTGVAAGAWAATGSGAQPSFGTRADVETLLSEGRG